MAEKVDENNIIKVWVGRFPSRERFDAYFEETYSDPDEESGEELEEPRSVSGPDFELH